MAVFFPETARKSLEELDLIFAKEGLPDAVNVENQLAKVKIEHAHVERA